MILVLDPSVSCYGWVVCCPKTLDPIQKGILTINKQSEETIVKSIKEELKQIIQKNKVTLIITEKPIGMANYNACKALWMVFSIPFCIHENTVSIQANIPKTTFNIKFKEEVRIWCEGNGLKFTGNKRELETWYDCCLIFHHYLQNK